VKAEPLEVDTYALTKLKGVTMAILFTRETSNLNTELEFLNNLWGLGTEQE
jgi:hypothetical protein